MEKLVAFLYTNSKIKIKIFISITIPDKNITKQYLP